MYARSYQQVGDPFLGGLIKGVGKFIGGAVKTVGGFLPGPAGIIARAAGGILGGAPTMPGGAMPIGPAARKATTAGTEAAIRAARGLGPKRKRMNYANQKALRRSLRRVTGYARQQKAVRKAAQEFAREFGPKRRAARRDLGPGHRHVR
ncbi:MAG: hypothetical protein JSV86_19925 [Gemmatimonadota bacterium]|nr:MAG: hypothetical protein JSV86_19925 [Gemmatimonadota bacterium]